MRINPRHPNERVGTWAPQRRLALAAANLGVVATFACLPSGGGSGGRGGVSGGSPVEFGTGTFHYVCTAWGDPACAGADTSESPLSRGATGEPLPQYIALGARFGAVHASGGRVRDVVAASDDLLTRDGTDFIAQQVGTVGVYATSTEFKMVGWSHVRIANVEELALDLPETVYRDGVSVHRVALAEGTPLQVGDTVDIGVRPWDAGHRVLGGALSYTWFSSDESVIEIHPHDADAPGAETDDVMSLRALAPGLSMIRVEGAGTHVAIVISVVEAPPRPPDAGLDADVGTDDAGVDAASDAGADPDADSGAGTDAATDGGVDADTGTVADADAAPDADDAGMGDAAPDVAPDAAADVGLIDASVPFDADGSGDAP